MRRPQPGAEIVEAAAAMRAYDLERLFELALKPPIELRHGQGRLSEVGFKC